MKQNEHVRYIAIARLQCTHEANMQKKNGQTNGRSQCTVTSRLGEGPVEREGRNGGSIKLSQFQQSFSWIHSTFPQNRVHKTQDQTNV